MTEIGRGGAHFSREQRAEANSCLDLLHYERLDGGLLSDFRDIALRGLADFTVDKHFKRPALVSRRIDTFCYGHKHHGYPPGEYSKGYVQRIEEFQDMPADGLMLSDVDIKNHQKFADNLISYRELFENGASVETAYGMALGIAATLYPGIQKSSTEASWQPSEILKSINNGGAYLTKVARRV